MPLERGRAQWDTSFGVVHFYCLLFRAPRSACCLNKQRSAGQQVDGFIRPFRPIDRAAGRATCALTLAGRRRALTGARPSVRFERAAECEASETLFSACANELLSLSLSLSLSYLSNLLAHCQLCTAPAPRPLRRFIARQRRSTAAAPMPKGRRRRRRNNDCLERRPRWPPPFRNCTTTAATVQVH